MNDATTTGMTEWDFWHYLVNTFTGPQFGNRVLLVIIIIIVVLTLIQVSKLKWDPWTQLARAIGTAINHDIIAEEQQLKAQITKDREDTRQEIQAVSDDMHHNDARLKEQLEGLRSQVAANQQANEDARKEDKAVQARNRILRLSDEIRKGDRHSKEMFDQTLEDITYYKTYCHDHIDFPNDKANASIKLIEDTYADCLKENDFE